MFTLEVVKGPWGEGGWGAVPEGAIGVLQDSRSQGTLSGKRWKVRR